MNVSLHTSALAATADEAVFLPWLKSVAARAAQHQRPTAVLVPLQADAYALKSRALAAGVGLFGVHFLTPGQLRDRLANHLGIKLRVPLREHLRLLLATAAERVNDRHSDEATASVAASPDQLLKAIDLIGGGGWSFSEAGPARLRPVVAEFQRLLKTAGFDLVHDADRVLLKAASDAEPLFANLFVTHFNALHWPQWPLLEATVRLASQAAVCLTDPQSEVETLDAIWIGTWEETFGSSLPIAADPPPPTTSVDFLVGKDTAEQARAVVAQTLRFLAEPGCQRLGILVPGAGALARRIATLLAEFDIPHHDGIAHHAPGPLEDHAWPAWCALQQDPRVSSLLRFLVACPTPERLFGGQSLTTITDALQRAFNDLLIDDLAILADALDPDRHHALVTGLRALPFLPERATLGALIERTAAIFHDLGWSERAAELPRLTSDWQPISSLVVTRRTWLGWLSETLTSWRTERSAAGRHPYSRVHLLPCAQAETQGWSHLILAGLNEGGWPPALPDTGLIGEEEIAALNRGIRRLNQRATTEGRQGEGHETVQPGHTLCLGPAQRRDLVLRQFLNTLESTTTALAVSAQLIDETAPERRLNPGEFFNRLHFRIRGRAISQEGMNALREETTRWLATAALWPEPPVDREAIAPTRRAFEARRDATQRFGGYEFALGTPPAQPLNLSATDWDKVFSQPAQIWMKHLLGVSASGASDETPWSLAIGQWVHHWLRGLAANAEKNTLAPKPDLREALARVRGRAEAFRDRLAAVLARHQRTLPDWWLSTWQQALLVAEQLATSVGNVNGPTHLATEWTLARGTALTLPDRGLLRVHGRIDLLLTSGEALEDVWIVDYKTGDRERLKIKELAAGTGLQLALYALALRELGATRAGVSLLTTSLQLDAPQLDLAALDTLGPLWRGLQHMQESGIFGMRGKWRDEYAYANDYPLATLAVDADTLEQKWALTHPEFSTEEDAS